MNKKITSPTVAKQYKVPKHSLSCQRWEGVGTEPLRKLIIYYHLETFNQGTIKNKLTNSLLD